MDERSVNVAEAKKHFSELLGKVAYGKEQILITKRGQPMARLVPADMPARNLADAKGWLDEEDPFFKTIDSIVRKRAKQTPRILQERVKK